jgi:ATP-dependent protease HslVU (ClpYQ) peptidase subunit
VTIIVALQDTVYNYLACDSLSMSDGERGYTDWRQKSLDLPKHKLSVAFAGMLSSAQTVMAAIKEDPEPWAEASDPLDFKALLEEHIEDNPNEYEMLLINPFGLFHMDGDGSVATNNDGPLVGGSGGHYFLGAYELYLTTQEVIIIPELLATCYQAVYRGCMSTRGPTRIMRVERASTP